jgi:hypothetical protein
MIRLPSYTLLQHSFCCIRPNVFIMALLGRYTTVTEQNDRAQPYRPGTPQADPAAGANLPTAWRPTSELPRVTRRNERS